MQKLNFPSYIFRFKNSENKVSIFDAIRKKFIILTPEEWVRQHVVNYLIEEKKYPKSLINVEKVLKVNGLRKRYDIVVFNTDGSIFILIECKAPEVKIAQVTFDQIARYNMTLEAEFLMVTNGLNHYFCLMDFENEKYEFLRELPDYGEIKKNIENRI
jgi:predicted type IV restriction endonuclease